MSKIITLTLNPCIDKTIWVDQLLPEKKLKAKHPEDEPGGGGINVSRAIQQLGYNSTAVYLNGGYNGLFLNELMQQEGIEFITAPIAENNRINLMIIDDSNLNEYRIGMDGPTVTEAELDNLLQILAQQKDYSFLVASGSFSPSIPSNFYTKVAKIVEANNAKLIVDTSGKALQETINENIYLLKPNLTELSMLCGINEQASIEEITLAAKKLLSQTNCTAIVVSMGANGALLVTATEQHHIIPPKVIVKSTVGAGDSMVAGMTIALSQNLPWKKVLQYGIACGTAATLNSGKSLCSKLDIDNILSALEHQ